MASTLDIPAGDALGRLINELRKLPHIGEKTAQRLAFHLMKSPRDRALGLAEAIRDVKDRVRFCGRCNNYAEQDLCPLCADPGRSQDIICVVEEPANVLALERTRSFRGQYHVLLGHLSPMEGIGPEELRIQGLLERVGAGGVTEVILATNPNVEGEATALYLARLLKPLGVRLSRIARGLPVGSDMDYADEVTLSKALEGRRELG